MSVRGDRGRRSRLCRLPACTPVRTLARDRPRFRSLHGERRRVHRRARFDSSYAPPSAIDHLRRAPRPSPGVGDEPELSAGRGYDAEGARRRPLPPVPTTNRRESHDLAAGQGGQGDRPSAARKGRFVPGIRRLVISGGVIRERVDDGSRRSVCPHPDPGAMRCPVSTRSRIPNSIRRIIG
jgi:hypothetical protein